MGKNIHLAVLYIITIVTVFCLAELGSRTATVMAENTRRDKLHRIVIDPGHGGEDGGATSCTGILESTYNLSISTRLRDLLNLMGYDTKMIRTDDVDVHKTGKSISQRKMSDLKERVRIANEFPNSILISIHQNQFTDSRYSGAQVFFSKNSGSEDLAKRLQAQFASTINPESRRQAKQAEGIYLMEHITCPGILVECGFLSNPREEALLRDAEYQKKICCIIASTVTQFVSNT